MSAPQSGQYGYRDRVDEVLDPLVMVEITRVEREVDRDLDRLIAGLDAEAVAARLDLTTLRASEAFRAGISGALEYTLVQRDLYLRKSRDGGGIACSAERRDEFTLERGAT